MLKKFNKMLGEEFDNNGFLGFYFGFLFVSSIANMYYCLAGEECLSIVELLFSSLALALLVFFFVVLGKFIYSIIKEKINKK